MGLKVSCAPENFWTASRHLIQHKCQSVAVFMNDSGFIIIQREPRWDEDEDVLIEIEIRS